MSELKLQGDVTFLVKKMMEENIEERFTVPVIAMSKIDHFLAERARIASYSGLVCDNVIKQSGCFLQ